MCRARIQDIPITLLEIMQRYTVTWKDFLENLENLRMFSLAEKADTRS